MKTLHLFIYLDYYPAGGMEDYRGAFETMEEVEERYYNLGTWDNWEVAQLQEDGSLKVIACNLTHKFER